MELPKRVSKQEAVLYEPVMNALKSVFSTLGECHLEITARGSFSDKLEKNFDDVALYMMSVEDFRPDITGFVKTNSSSIDVITVEVKRDSPTIKDVFQAKNYGPIFNAKYVLLISTKHISEKKRRLILKRKEIIARFPSESVILARFDKDKEYLPEKFEVDMKLYDACNPEPFATYWKTFEAENLRITDRKSNPIRVLVSNAGEVSVKIVKVKMENLPSYGEVNVVLDPRDQKWINLQQYVLWGMIGEPGKVELITELGKSFSHTKEAK